MTTEEKLKRARQLLKDIIDHPRTANDGQGEYCYYCHRFTTEDGSMINTETGRPSIEQQAHARNCPIRAITNFLLED